MSRPPDEAEWQALLARRPLPRLYAVTTTGIVCAFGCPARAPLRAHVRLFDSLAEAEAAGFRPCRRCGAEAPLRAASAGNSR
jgi:AraC family transcriptional regulator of adaptative response/methylated-DNA-[protein]-cysteine methyltransferase